MTRTIALVGDYSPDVIAHRAIPIALALAREATGCTVDWKWVATSELTSAATDLAPFAGLWVVPASPYANMPGVIDAIQHVREIHRPFLGTCGGFQHAIVEFARNVAGLHDADHAETNPAAATMVVSPLACALKEKTGLVRFAHGTLIRAAYGKDTATEGYHCSYGIDPTHLSTLAWQGLRFSAWDEAGDVRAAELPSTVHPFFVGTLFQPERAALRQEVPPLVKAFVAAVAR